MNLFIKFSKIVENFETFRASINKIKIMLGHGYMKDTKLDVWVRAMRRRRGSSSRIAEFTTFLPPSLVF